MNKNGNGIIGAIAAIYGRAAKAGDSVMRWITEAEFEVLAVADLDAEAMIRAKWRAARRVPHVRTLRRALDLTREEFMGVLSAFPPQEP